MKPIFASHFSTHGRLCFNCSPSYPHLRLMKQIPSISLLVFSMSLSKDSFFFSFKPNCDTIETDVLFSWCLEMGMPNSEEVLMT